MTPWDEALTALAKQHIAMWCWHKWKQVWRGDFTPTQSNVIPIPRGFDLSRIGWPGAWGQFRPSHLRCTKCGKVRAQ